MRNVKNSMAKQHVLYYKIIGPNKISYSIVEYANLLSYYQMSDTTTQLLKFNNENCVAELYNANYFE